MPSRPEPPWPARTWSDAELEARLAALWGEILLLDPAGLTPRAQFTLLGGSSLELLQLQRRVEDCFGLPPRAGRLLPLGSLEAMRRHLRERLAEECLAEECLARASPVGRQEAADRPWRGPLPASAGQGGLWFLQELQGEAPTLYNCGVELAWEGALDVSALERALEGLVRRHEALRCSLRYPEEGKALLMDVLPALPVSLPPRRVSEEDLPRLRRVFMAQPFSLHSPPLFRALLLRLGAERHHLLLALHHAITDGWSGGVLLRDLLACYRTCLSPEGEEVGGNEALPPAAQYGEFCRWQCGGQAAALFVGQRAWWRETLRDLPPPALLPGEREGAGEGGGGRAQDCSAARESFLLDPELAAALEGRARAAGATLFTLLLAVYALLLGRRSGREEIVLGCPVVNRRLLRWESALGFFANPLPLRLRVDGQAGFPALLAAVQRRLSEALAHQDLPFAHMPALAGAGPDEDYPLFRQLFAFQDWRQDLALPGARLALARLKPDCCHYPLGLDITRGGEGLAVDFDFHAARFPPGTVSALAQDYRALLSSLAAGENDPFELLSP